VHEAARSFSRRDVISISGAVSVDNISSELRGLGTESSRTDPRSNLSLKQNKTQKKRRRNAPTRMMDVDGERGGKKKVFTKVLMRMSTMLLEQVHNRNLYPI
jgi:hypothetical protein